MTGDYPGPELETGEEPVPSLLGRPGPQQKVPGESVLAPGFQPHSVARYPFPRCCQPQPSHGILQPWLLPVFPNGCILKAILSRNPGSLFPSSAWA